MPATPLEDRMLTVERELSVVKQELVEVKRQLAEVRGQDGLAEACDRFDERLPRIF